LPACEGAQYKVRLWLASQYAQNFGETNFWDLRFYCISRRNVKARGIANEKIISLGECTLRSTSSR